MRAPWRRFLAARVPTAAEAGAALRALYALAFLAQTTLAALVALTLGWAVGSSPRPNDVVATVLLLFGFLHLPLGAFLAWSASRSPGKGAAMAGAIVASVLLSVPAWFLALAVVSGQRMPFLIAGLAVLSAGYALGFAFVPRFVRAATTPEDPVPEAVAETG